MTEPQTVGAILTGNESAMTGKEQVALKPWAAILDANFRTTLDTTELDGAMSQFQGKIQTIESQEKGQEGHRTFMYADLANLLEAALPILSEFGLSLSQISVGTSALITRLAHNSGQWYMGKTDVGPELGEKYTTSDKMKVMKKVRRADAFAILGLCATREDVEDEPGKDEPGKAKLTPKGQGMREALQAKQARADPAQTVHHSADPRPAAAAPPEDQRFFGDAADGQFYTWLHSSRLVTRGEGQKGMWALYEAITVTGERIMTFSDSDSVAFGDAVRLKSGLMIGWERGSNKFKENIMVKQLAPVDGGLAPPGSVTVAITGAEKVPSQGAAFRRVMTNRGKFVSNQADLASVLDSAAGSGEEHRITFQAYKAGRALRSVAPIQEPGAVETDEETPPPDASP